jgi:hypothetical protein
MRHITSISTFALTLVISLTALGSVFALPFYKEGCRRDPNAWTEMRSNVNYACFNQICCLDPSCLGDRPIVRPTIEARCFPALPNGNLKFTPSGFGHGHGLTPGGGTVSGACTGSISC